MATEKGGALPYSPAPTERSAETLTSRETTWDVESPLLRGIPDSLSGRSGGSSLPAAAAAAASGGGGDVVSRNHKLLCCLSLVLLALSVLACVAALADLGTPASPETSGQAAGPGGGFDLRGRAPPAGGGGSLEGRFGAAPADDDRLGTHGYRSAGYHGGGGAGGYHARGGGEHYEKPDPNEETQCAAAQDVNIRTPVMVGNASAANWRVCNQLCLNATGCGVWTWSPWSRRCFMNELTRRDVITSYRPGWMSGPPSKLCAAEGPVPTFSAVADPGAVHAAVSSSGDPSWEHADKGVLQSRLGGKCLDALNATVRMFTCLDAHPRQYWTFNRGTGQLRLGSDTCLTATNESVELTNLTVGPCDAASAAQRWDWDDKGRLKARQGICIDGAESTVDGGAVYMRACVDDNDHLLWNFGPYVLMPPTQRPKVRVLGSSLYCYALMLPFGYEKGLLAVQYEKKVSLFQCEDYAVYSNLSIVVSPGLETKVVDISLQCKFGGEFGTALNTDIFIAVWKRVVQDGVYLSHDWTVKVDPDCVFFPGRLRGMLSVHKDTPQGVYLNNCKFGLHGPLEVFSSTAITTWVNGVQTCTDFFSKLCMGDCFWGEDLFVDQCLWKVLGAAREDDFRLLVEDHCDAPPGWRDCKDPVAAAFHPFKNWQDYEGCLSAAV